MNVCYRENCKCIGSRLLNCTKSGSVDEAKSILQSAEDPSKEVDTSGRTLLHYAVEHRAADVARYLLDAGCRVDAQDAYGMTSLMLAVDNCDCRIVEMLVKSGDVDVRDKCYYSVLDVAFDKLLSLEQTIDGRVIDGNNCTEYRILQVLLDKVNDDFSKGNLEQWLSSARDSTKLVIVTFGSAQISEFVLRNSYPIDYQEWQGQRTAFHCCVRFGRLENAKILLRLGARVDTLDREGRSPIQDYTRGCEDADEDSELLSALAKSWAGQPQPDKACIDSVKWLLENGNKTTVKTLLQSGIDVEACLLADKSLLEHLVVRESDDVIDLLDELDLKFEPNELASNGRTVLERAIRRRSLKKVQFLLEHGAVVDPTSLTKEGTLGLITLCLFCGPPDERIIGNEIVELLLQYGYLDVQSLFNFRHFQLGDYPPAKRMILAHLALLKTKGQASLGAECSMAIESDAQSKAHFELCLKQLEQMTSIEVHGTVNLFKLLTATDDKLLVYARNQHLLAAFDQLIANISHLERNYLSFARKRLARAKDSVELQAQVATIIEMLTGIATDVYHAIVYRIISYLDRQDLTNLCKIQN